MKNAVISLIASICLVSTAANADPALDQQLCAASQAGDGVQISALLHQGADANAVCSSKSGDDHFSPLYLAVGIDSVQGVTALLAKGAKVDAKETKYGLSPVFKIKSPAVGKLLLRRHADINALNGKGETPFQYLTDRIGGTFTEDQAAAVGALLLDHGADVNAPSGNMTPLTMAVTFEDTTYIAFLLNHGANAAWRDSQGESALGLAIRLEGLVKPEYAAGYRDVEALLRARGAPP